MDITTSLLGRVNRYIENPVYFLGIQSDWEDINSKHSKETKCENVLYDNVQIFVFEVMPFNGKPAVS